MALVVVLAVQQVFYRQLGEANELGEGEFVGAGDFVAGDFAVGDVENGGLGTGEKYLQRRNSHVPNYLLYVHPLNALPVYRKCPLLKAKRIGLHQGLNRISLPIKRVTLRGDQRLTLETNMFNLNNTLY